MLSPFAPIDFVIIHAVVTSYDLDLVSGYFIFVFDLFQSFQFTTTANEVFELVIAIAEGKQMTPNIGRKLTIPSTMIVVYQSTKDMSYIPFPIHILILQTSNVEWYEIEWVVKMKFPP
jgi:hypothetical protein